MMQERMLYSRYKKHYADCEVVRGSYDEEDRTIVVLVPEGRMKPSGTRGERYKYFTNIRLLDPRDGKEYTGSAKAICWENAKRQWEKAGYIVLD